MAFTEEESTVTGFRVLHRAGDPELEYSIVLLCDSLPGNYELKLLENFHKLGQAVIILVPENDTAINQDFDFSQVIHALVGLPGKVVLVSMGGFAPYLIENFAYLENVHKVIFINPSYRGETSTRMAGFELPVLVVTSTPGNLDHDPESVKYHDLISGSSITYVRGIDGNPLYKRFTQSFNSIQRFLLND